MDSATVLTLGGKVVALIDSLPVLTCLHHTQLFKRDLMQGLNMGVHAICLYIESVCDKPQCMFVLRKCATSKLTSRLLLE